MTDGEFDLDMLEEEGDCEKAVSSASVPLLLLLFELVLPVDSFI